MVALGMDNASFILQKFSNKNMMFNLQQLLNTNKHRGDMRKVDGTNFGVSFVGFYDFPASLLMKMLIYQNTDNRSRGVTGGDFIQTLNDCNICETIMNFLLNINPKTDISPKGFTELISFFHEGLNINMPGFFSKLFKNTIKMLCLFLKDNQLLSI